LNASAPSTSPELQGPGGASTDNAALGNSVLVLSLPMTWAFAMVGLLYPMLAIFFREAGLSESQIAVLYAIPAAVTLFANQMWGYFADVWLNRRLVTMLLCLASSVVAWLFMGTTSFWMLALLVALNGLFNDPRIPMLNAKVLANRSGEALFGRIRVIGSFAFVGATFVAAWLTEAFPTLGIRVIFPAAIVVNLLWILSLVPLKDYPPGSGRPGRANAGPGFWEAQRILVRKPVVRWFLLFLMLYQLPHIISYLLQMVLIQDLGGDAETVATAVSLAAASEALIFWCGKQIFARIRLMWLFFLAAAAQALRWGLIAAVPSIPVIFLTAMLHALTFGLMYLCAVLLMNRETPAALRSSSQTLLAVVHSSVGAVIGPALSAAILPFIALREWYAIAAFGALLPLLPWLAMKRHYEAEHRVSGFWIRPGDRIPRAN
jgi:PPP family 3-phenylpropionic acid transporter